MKILGIRCSNKDCSIFLMSGTQESPNIESSETITFPKDFNQAESLHWFFLEINRIFENNQIDAVAIKGAEPMAQKTNTLIARIQNEAIIYLASATAGVINVVTKCNASIAKELGLKGRGKYLQSKLDTSVIVNYNNYSKKEQEAILVGWSELK